MQTRTSGGFEKYSISKDSIGTDGLFYKGVGNYYNINNPTQNNSWFKSSEYDIDKRKIKYQVWNEVNGVRNYYLNERFTYNGKGLKKLIIQIQQLIGSKTQVGFTLILIAYFQ